MGEAVRNGQGQAVAGRGSVRVYGRNFLAGPLFETSDAQTVVMCDDDGKACVILARMVDNTWVMAASADKDWEAAKAQLGVD